MFSHLLSHGCKGLSILICVSSLMIEKTFNSCEDFVLTLRQKITVFKTEESILAFLCSAHKGANFYIY